MKRFRHRVDAMIEEYRGCWRGITARHLGKTDCHDVAGLCDSVTRDLARLFRNRSHALSLGNPRERGADPLSHPSEMCDSAARELARQFRNRHPPPPPNVFELAALTLVAWR